MKKFSLISLFGFVAIVALVAAVVVGQWRMREYRAELESLRAKNETVGGFYGWFEVEDPDKYYMRGFYDPYSTKDGALFRFYFPKDTDCTFYFSDGFFPKDGIPEKRMKMERLGDRYSAGYHVLVVDLKKNPDGGTDVNARLVADDYVEGCLGEPFVDVGTLKWRSKRRLMVLPAFPSTSFETQKFDLEKPFVVTKQFRLNNVGDAYGLMI